MYQGIHRDWKKLENENGDGKVMEHEKSAWNFVISHEVLRFCPLILQNLCLFAGIKKFSSLHFLTFSANVANAKFDRRDGH